MKVEIEPSAFLERTYRDICGPIHTPKGLFGYCMVLIDGPTIWSHVCLFLSQNLEFTKLLNMI